MVNAGRICNRQLVAKEHCCPEDSPNPTEGSTVVGIYYT